MRLVFAAALIVALNACASVGDVQPWQKGNLAKRPMSFEMDRLDERFTQHTYQSKENMSGGYGVGGGGCGCN